MSLDTFMYFKLNDLKILSEFWGAMLLDTL